MAPLDTVIVRYDGETPSDPDLMNGFAAAVCHELARFSDGPDGIVFIGWDDLHSAAGDHLDKDTGTLTLRLFGSDGGLAILQVPQFELGSELSAQFLFGVPENRGERNDAARELVERLVAPTARPLPHGFAYDVALSFASEQREFVRAVHHALDDLGVRVFFDEAHTADLWGRDGIEVLNDVYGREALFTVMFISAEYVSKAWPTVERRAALATLLDDPTQVRVLPVRFDDVEVPGMPPSTFYLPAEHHTPEAIADLVAEKLRATGYFTAASVNRMGSSRAQAHRVQFRAVLDSSEDSEFIVRYRIHNGSSSPIEDVMLVVADPGAPQCDPANQVGTALELIVGAVGVDETIEDEHVVSFRHDSPVFAEHTRLGGLIWTDHDGAHWFSSGAQVRRNPYPPRLC